VRSALARPNETRVESVMTREVVTITPDEPIRAAAELLVAHDVSLLPVIDGERVAGVVNRHDVLRALA